jgi:hypothetical protein
LHFRAPYSLSSWLPPELCQQPTVLAFAKILSRGKNSHFPVNSNKTFQI